MNRVKFISVAILVSLLNSCASNVVNSFIKEETYDALYLRGVFSWWEADEKYKLIKLSDNVYSTTIELIADGQPYDFKFADTNWTPGFNCGYASEIDKVIVVGSSVKANCEATDENFRFTPVETGIFQFIIDFGELDTPKVSIEYIID
jgi:hypothetical protein